MKVNRRILILSGVYAGVVALIIWQLPSIAFLLGLFAYVLPLIVGLSPAGAPTPFFVILGSMLIILITQITLSEKRPGLIEKLVLLGSLVILIYNAFVLLARLHGGATPTLYELAFLLSSVFGVYVFLVLANVSDRPTLHIRLFLVTGLGLATVVAGFFGSVRDEMIHAQELQKAKTIVSISDCKKFIFVDTWQACIKKNFTTPNDYTACLTAAKYDADRGYCQTLQKSAIDDDQTQQSKSIQDCNNFNTDHGLAKCLLKNLKTETDFQYCASTILLKGYLNLERINCFAVYAFRTDTISVCEQQTEGGVLAKAECKNRVQRLRDGVEDWYQTRYK